MKKIIAILLAAIMALSMAACGSTSSTNDPATPATNPTTSTPSGTGSQTGTDPVPTGDVTIKFANYALTEAGYTEFWNGVKSGFEAKYPNIKIEYVTAPYGEIVNQVINMAASGQKVDLLFGEVSWIPTLQDAGLSVPVDTVVNKDFLNGIIPNILDAMKVDGKPYAVPLNVSPFLLYYNKDLFTQAGLDPNKPPKTYDEMLQMADKLSSLKTKDGNKVYAFGQTTASVPISGSSLTAMVKNFGGNVLTADGKLDVDNQGFKDAFNMVKLLNEKGYNPQNAKLKDLRNLFALGQLAMYYDQSWGFNGVSSINPDAKNFTASAAPLSGGGGSGESLLQASVLMTMDNGDQQKQATNLLVQYILSKDELNKYLTVDPGYSAVESMKDLDVIVNNPVTKGAADSLTKTTQIAFIPKLNDLNLELTKLAQDITVGGKSVDDAIAGFKKAAGALVNK